MNDLDKLNSNELNRLNGKIFYFDRNLYSQIKYQLLELMQLTSMLEEAKDETIREHLLTQKGAVIDELLRYNQEWDYPDYPEMDEEA